MSRSTFARLLSGSAAVASAACLSPAWAAPPSTLNDTGMTQCAVWDDAQGEMVFTRKCEGTGQDAAFGRDVANPSGKNGRAGFNYQKIDDTGEPLPRTALNWRCVVDRVSGLEWEVKTADGSIYDYRNLYTNIGDGRSNDTSSYVSTVNSVGLCGANDWRLPTRGELESLLDYSRSGFSSMVDPDWFPNTLASLHWSSTNSSINGGDRDYWWAVDFLNGIAIWRGGEYDTDPVRLVRGGSIPPAQRWKMRGANSSEALDTRSRLIWRRCAEGRTWTGSACSGNGTVFLTASDAMDYAVAEAARTGKPWRAPNVKELSTLVDTDINFPAVDRIVFPGFESDRYHTGTVWVQNPVYTWRVDFARGEVTTDYWGGRLLLVRDEP